MHIKFNKRFIRLNNINFILCHFLLFRLTYLRCPACLLGIQSNMLTIVRDFTYVNNILNRTIRMPSEQQK